MTFQDIAFSNLIYLRFINILEDMKCLQQKQIQVFDIKSKAGETGKFESRR